MCPERQIISLYVDGELPSPWKEKLETHLESCPACRKTLAAYNYIGENLEDTLSEKIREVQDRVWSKISAPGLVTIPESIVNDENSSQRNEKAKVFNNPAAEREPAVRRGIKPSPRIKPVKRIWSRTISLPLPAAAAAAVVIVVLFFVLTGVRSGVQISPQDSMKMASIGLDDQGLVPVNDMSGVLQYLSNQDNNDLMVIQLPGSRHFSRSGDPALINAADYSRARRNLSP